MSDDKSRDADAAPGDARQEQDRREQHELDRGDAAFGSARGHAAARVPGPRAAAGPAGPRRAAPGALAHARVRRGSAQHFPCVPLPLAPAMQVLTSFALPFTAL